MPEDNERKVFQSGKYGEAKPISTSFQSGKYGSSSPISPSFQSGKYGTAKTKPPKSPPTEVKTETQPIISQTQTKTKSPPKLQATKTPVSYTTGYAVENREIIYNPDGSVTQRLGYVIRPTGPIQVRTDQKGNIPITTGKTTITTYAKKSNPSKIIDYFTEKKTQIQDKWNAPLPEYSTGFKESSFYFKPTKKPASPKEIITAITKQPDQPRKDYIKVEGEYYKVVKLADYGIKSKEKFGTISRTGKVYTTPQKQSPFLRTSKFIIETEAIGKVSSPIFEAGTNIIIKPIQALRSKLSSKFVAYKDTGIKIVEGVTIPQKRSELIKLQGKKIDTTHVTISSDLKYNTVLKPIESGAGKLRTSIKQYNFFQSAPKQGETLAYGGYAGIGKGISTSKVELVATNPKVKVFVFRGQDVKTTPSSITKQGILKSVEYQTKTPGTYIPAENLFKRSTEGQVISSVGSEANPIYQITKNPSGALYGRSTYYNIKAVEPDFLSRSPRLSKAYQSVFSRNVRVDFYESQLTRIGTGEKLSTKSKNIVDIGEYSSSYGRTYYKPVQSATRNPLGFGFSSLSINNISSSKNSFITPSSRYSQASFISRSSPSNSQSISSSLSFSSSSSPFISSFVSSSPSIGKRSYISTSPAFSRGPSLSRSSSISRSPSTSRSSSFFDRSFKVREVLPKIPEFNKTSGFSFSTPKRKYTQPKSYTPSLFAIAKDIRAKKTRTIGLSGLEVRPIIGA